MLRRIRRPRIERTAASSTQAGDSVTKDGAGRQKLIRNVVALSDRLGALFDALSLGVLERHPRTDDAAALPMSSEAFRASVARSLSGCPRKPIGKQGDLLFEIDPADYEQALERAKSALAAVDQQIEVGRAQDEQLKFGVKAAEAGVQSATAQLKQSEDTLHRLEPLLPKHFATAEQVDEARTKVAVAAQEVAAEEAKT